MRAYGTNGTNGTIRGTDGTNHGTNQESGNTIMANPSTTDIYSTKSVP
jgi:hypothetical protein